MEFRRVWERSMASIKRKSLFSRLDFNHGFDTGATAESAFTNDFGNATVKRLVLCRRRCSQCALHSYLYLKHSSSILQNNGMYECDFMSDRTWAYTTLLSTVFPQRRTMPSWLVMSWHFIKKQVYIRIILYGRQPKATWEDAAIILPNDSTNSQFGPYIIVWRPKLCQLSLFQSWKNKHEKYILIQHLVFASRDDSQVILNSSFLFSVWPFCGPRLFVIWILLSELERKHNPWRTFYRFLPDRVPGLFVYFKV